VELTAPGVGYQCIKAGPSFLGPAHPVGIDVVKLPAPLGYQFAQGLILNFRVLIEGERIALFGFAGCGDADVKGSSHPAPPRCAGELLTAVQGSIPPGRVAARVRSASRVGSQFFSSPVRHAGQALDQYLARAVGGTRIELRETSGRPESGAAPGSNESQLRARSYSGCQPESHARCGR